MAWEAHKTPHPCLQVFDAVSVGIWFGKTTGFMGYATTKYSEKL